MKRILTFLLAITILAGMGITALAASADPGSGSDHRGGAPKTTTIDVTASYEESAVTRPTSYCVRVSWDDMSLHCAVTDARTWDPDTHSYTGTRTARWTTDGNHVTVNVDNRSEAAVNVTAAYEAASGDAPLPNLYFVGAGTEASKTVSIPAAEPGVNGNNGYSHTDSFTLTATGQPSNELANYLAEHSADNINIGTVTITVTDPNAGGD